jgi:hypothetical protein
VTESPECVAREEKTIRRKWMLNVLVLVVLTIVIGLVQQQEHISCLKILICVDFS